MSAMALPADTQIGESICRETLPDYRRGQLETRPVFGTVLALERGVDGLRYARVQWDDGCECLIAVESE